MTKASKKSLISWIVTLGLPILILLIPTSEAFTGDIRMFFAITLMGIAMFCFDEMENAVAGILMMTLYIVTGIAPWTASFLHGQIPSHGTFSQRCFWWPFWKIPQFLSELRITALF